MKKTSQFSFLFAVLAAFTFLLVSCQPAKPDLAKIKPEIQAMEDAYAAGLKAKDANAVIAYYADDAVSMVNNGPVASGHDALLNQWILVTVAAQFSHVASPLNLPVRVQPCHTHDTQKPVGFGDNFVRDLFFR